MMVKKGVSLSYQINQWFLVGIDLLFPAHCAGCQKFGVQWCASCQSSTIEIKNPVCEICGKTQKVKERCFQCKHYRPIYDAARSLYKYEGPFRKAVTHLKFHGNGGLGEIFSTKLIKLIQKLDWKFEIVSPVPLGRSRFKERGYNQAAFLAYPISKYFCSPYRPQAIKRLRETRSQIGLTSEERKENVRGAFFARREIVRGKKILLVDDVFTTGSTINECAAAFKNAGARSVYCVTLARAERY